MERSHGNQLQGPSNETGRRKNNADLLDPRDNVTITNKTTDTMGIGKYYLDAARGDGNHRPNHEQVPGSQNLYGLAHELELVLQEQSN